MWGCSSGSRSSTDPIINPNPGQPGTAQDVTTYHNDQARTSQNLKEATLTFSVSNAHLSSNPIMQTSASFSYPGASSAISANGSTNAILWAAENGGTAALRAYDANNLSRELYNSNQSGSRDQFGTGNKFITPTVVNGKVYVGTTNGVVVFGLLR